VNTLFDAGEEFRRWCEGEVRRISDELKKVRSGELRVTDKEGNDLTAQREKDLCDRGIDLERLKADWNDVVAARGR
jgi:hypothetical protein